MKKKSISVFKRGMLLAAVFSLFAILHIAALSPLAEESSFKGMRHGKEVIFKKDTKASITKFVARKEGAKTTLYWKIKNRLANGVFVLMRSQDGINYHYAHFKTIAAVSNENESYSIEDTNENYETYYKLMFISNNDTYIMHENAVNVSSSSPLFRMMQSES